MATKTQITLLCVLAIVQSGCNEAPSQEVTFVRDCFDGYKQAILDQNGDAAVAFVDLNTLGYYEKMRKLALDGSSADVRKLSTIDKIMVLMLRQLVPVRELSAMTAESLFVYAVDKGWVGKESVINNALGDIEVSGSSATGVHISEGRPSPFKWNFQNENGKWKIDITSVMPIANEAFSAVVQQSGLSEDDFLFRVLESISEKEVSDEIWEPLTGSANQ